MPDERRRIVDRSGRSALRGRRRRQRSSGRAVVPACAVGRGPVVARHRGGLGGDDRQPGDRGRRRRYRRALRAPRPAAGCRAGAICCRGTTWSATRPLANDGDGRDADASDPGDWVTQAEIVAARQRALPLRDVPGEELVARHPAVRPDRRAHEQRHRHGRHGARRPRVARARARQVRRLRLGHHRGHALGRRALRARRAGQPVSRAGDQPQPRRRRGVLGRVSGGGRRDHGRGHADRGGGRQHSGHAVATAGQLRRRDRGGRAAPRRHQGRLLLAGPRGGDQRARGQLRQHGRGLSVPVSRSSRPRIRARPCRPARPTPTATTSRSGRASRRPSSPAVAALALSVPPDARRRSRSRSCCRRTARPFPTAGERRLQQRGAQCTAPQYSLMGRPVDQQECYCTTTTCGAGMLDAGAALSAAASGAVASPRLR